jgi:hypothetical protein
MGRSRTGITALMGAALAVGVAGCGAIADRAAEQVIERAIESEVGGSVDIDRSGDSFTIESEDGTFAFGATDVPASIASEFDLPRDFDVLSASELTTDGETTSLVVLYRESAPGSVLDDLLDQARSKGWTVGTTYTAGGTSGFEAVRGDERLNVFGQSDGATTNLTIGLTRPAG